MANKTIYSKIVDFKKRFIKTQLIPDSIAFHIDSFFNNLHNVLVISKDLTRDYLTRSKDITRDSLIKSRDIARDSLIRSRDIARDYLIRSKDLAKDSLVRSRDLTRGLAKDSFSLAKDSIAAIESGYSKKQSFLKRHILFIFYFLLNVVHVLYLSITLRKFRITEKCDQEAVRQIQKIIVNSENVKKRVSLFYGRESVAINPPIETSIFLFKQNDGYWLSVNRITPEKRIEIQTAAFLKLGKEKLIIVGGHEDYHSRYVENLKKQSLENVIFMGSVSQNDLIDLYANCKGLIATSKDEDFGMNAVEAMASGKPVIAPNEGGYKETVTRETGILIDDIDEDKLVEAVKEMNDRISYNCQEIKNACLRRAGEFDTNRFTKKFLLEAGLGA